MSTDTRLVNVALTGFLTNNGTKSGAVPAVYAEQHPAYAAIDLTRAKNFYVDARPIHVRTDTVSYSLLRIYISSRIPPLYYPNFEFDIFITPPRGYLLFFIEVYANKQDAENAQVVGSSAKKLYTITNEIPTTGDYSEGTGIITFKVFNNSIVLKGVSGGLTGSVY